MEPRNKKKGEAKERAASFVILPNIMRAIKLKE